MVIRRGDIFYADLRPVIVLIIQNAVGNRHSPTVICAAITSQMNKAKLPTHVELDCHKYDLVKDSVVLLEQLRTIDKKRLKDKVCHLDHQILIKIAATFWHPLFTHHHRRFRRTIGSGNTARTGKIVAQ